MSKIFDAYRKQMGEVSDLVSEVGRAGLVQLYPPPRGAQRDDFNRLANQLLGMRKSGSASVLAMASSARGEGASFVSYNTAVFLATAFNRRVAWVDANFQSPQLKLLSEDEDAETLSALLREPARARALKVEGNLRVIAGGDDLPRAKGPLAGPQLPELLRALKDRFDFVLLDLPPVLESPDTPLIAATADGFLLVIEQKLLKREVIGHGLELLREGGANVIGSVINRRSYELPKGIYERL